MRSERRLGANGVTAVCLVTFLSALPSIKAGKGIGDVTLDIDAGERPLLVGKSCFSSVRLPDNGDNSTVRGEKKCDNEWNGEKVVPSSWF